MDGGDEKDETVQLSARVRADLKNRAQAKFRQEGLSFTQWLEVELWDYVHEGQGHPHSLQDQAQALWARMDLVTRQRFIQWLQAQQ